MAPQVFVTGSPGVGKTTLITKVLSKIRESYPSIKVQGFYTREVRNRGVREGFEAITVHGAKCTLASIHGSTSCEAVGQYKVDVPGFEALVLPELRVRDETQLFVVDEVGKMELFSQEFYPAVEAIIKSGVPVLGSVPVKRQSLKQVEKLVSTRGIILYTIDKNNRDDVADEIFAAFNRHLSGS